MTRRKRGPAALPAVAATAALAALVLGQASTALASVPPEGAIGTTANSGTVTFPTTHAGSTYSLANPTQSNLWCEGYHSHQIFSGPDDTWGNGAKSDRETACTEAMYVAEQERQMLSSWLGRNGMDGQGGWVPIRMGLGKMDAYYSDSKHTVTLGRQKSGEWMSWTDVVAHELGHAIDDHMPGGISGDQTAEFVADAFGAAVEHFADNPVDTPDYVVGEMGDEVIRNMYDPAALGDPGCFHARTIDDEETHAQAGPGNHWFYLLAEGSHPGNEQPDSPTCNRSTVDGVGIKTAIQVLYNAMLLKTPSATYSQYRLWTLAAAKDMDSSCGLYTKVKAAWDAVRVPARAREATCGPKAGTPGAGTTRTGQLLFSNLDDESGYQPHAYDLSSFAQKTVTTSFSGTADDSQATSFVIDDTALVLRSLRPHPSGAEVIG